MYPGNYHKPDLWWCLWNAARFDVGEQPICPVVDLASPFLRNAIDTDAKYSNQIVEGHFVWATKDYLYVFPAECLAWCLVRWFTHRLLRCHSWLSLEGKCDNGLRSSYGLWVYAAYWRHPSGTDPLPKVSLGSIPLGIENWRNTGKWRPTMIVASQFLTTEIAVLVGWGIDCRYLLKAANMSCLYESTDQCDLGYEGVLKIT